MNNAPLLPCSAIYFVVIPDMAAVCFESLDSAFGNPVLENQAVSTIQREVILTHY